MKKHFQRRKTRNDDLELPKTFLDLTKILKETASCLTFYITFCTAAGDCITIRHSSRSGFVTVLLEKPVEPAFRPAWRPQRNRYSHVQLLTALLRSEWCPALFIMLRKPSCCSAAILLQHDSLLALFSLNYLQCRLLLGVSVKICRTLCKELTTRLRAFQHKETWLKFAFQMNRRILKETALRK